MRVIHALCICCVADLQDVKCIVSVACCAQCVVGCECLKKNVHTVPQA